MDFTQNFWIGLVVGALLGFVICRAMRYLAHDTGPHKVTPPAPPPE